ncbi:hypothetical protein VZT92_003569 [Zoarces viviparus]|uniref:Uncharacterized protein n=1 Tax=Zoarces viviparus TaxID=48416 RepID=A0AAW1FW58_ZOAVI
MTGGSTGSSCFVGRWSAQRAVMKRSPPGDPVKDSVQPEYKDKDISYETPLSLEQVEGRHFPTLPSQDFTGVTFWGDEALVSSSAALWIIKRHVAVDLESSWRAGPCESAADSGETSDFRWTTIKPPEEKRTD